MGTVAYTKGLHELGAGLHAYLQPNGSWGWSNAGLITGGETSLLVDTLFDIPLTQEMLDAMRPLTQTRPLDAAVNTHANGDHCFGNDALPRETEIYATAAAVEDMKEEPPELLRTLLATDLGPDVNSFAERIFGPFQFDGLEQRLPSSTFAGTLELDIGGRTIEMIELGPAHTAGDAIVHVPDCATVFTGDILIVDTTPVLWAGPVANWLSACDQIVELGARTLVPGHGPVTTDESVRDVKRYLEYVRDEARARFDDGMDPFEAAEDIELDDFADWSGAERVVANVHELYREFDPGLRPVSRLKIFEGMARWAKRRARSG
jgi:cyclase